MEWDSLTSSFSRGEAGSGVEEVPRVGRWSRLLLVSGSMSPLVSSSFSGRFSQENPRAGCSWLDDRRGCTVLAHTDSANGFGTWHVYAEVDPKTNDRTTEWNCSWGFV